MHVDVQDRGPRQESAAQCPADGMPLFATIVGPRCPLCGAAAAR